MEIQHQAFSVAQTAQMLGVSEWLVREACRRGEIRHRRLGARVIIPAEAITDFLTGANDDEGEAATS